MGVSLRVYVHVIGVRRLQHAAEVFQLWATSVEVCAWLAQLPVMKVTSLTADQDHAASYVGRLAFVSYLFGAHTASGVLGFWGSGSSSGAF